MSVEHISKSLRLSISESDDTRPMSLPCGDLRTKILPSDLGVKSTGNSLQHHFFVPFLMRKYPLVLIKLLLLQHARLVFPGYSMQSLAEDTLDWSISQRISKIPDLKSVKQLPCKAEKMEPRS